MVNTMYEYIERLKNETNNINDIVYRKKKIKNKDIYIIYSDSLTSGETISNFIIKSLDEINLSNKIYKSIKDKIYNFKIQDIDTYDELCNFLHSGFTIIIIPDENKMFALETKSGNKRGISIPTSENTLRGAKDCFVEDFQINISLVKKRIKSNMLWKKELDIGKHTKTKVNILYMNDLVDNDTLNEVYEKLKNIDTDILTSGTIKNILSSSKVMPTIISTERPDRVSRALLNGKICIIVDNDPYVLILPVSLNDFMKTSEDYFAQNINTTLTRILRYLAFYIALFAPALYIALITYNQEMLPKEFLINFTMQRASVPFPAFFEAFMMMICFELLRESDIRTSGYAGSSLSIVGALILGDASVNAGIVSPIMIIVIAITAITSLPFNEYDLINALRWYRILFMLGASFLGIIGIVFAFIYFIINLSSTYSFNTPYLTPFIPTNINKLKDSIIKVKI